LYRRGRAASVVTTDDDRNDGTAAQDCHDGSISIRRPFSGTRERSGRWEDRRESRWDYPSNVVVVWDGDDWSAVDRYPSRSHSDIAHVCSFMLVAEAMVDDTVAKKVAASVVQTGHVAASGCPGESGKLPRPESGRQMVKHDDAVVAGCPKPEGQSSSVQLRGWLDKSCNRIEQMLREEHWPQIVSDEINHADRRRGRQNIDPGRRKRGPKRTECWFTKQNIAEIGQLDGEDSTWRRTSCHPSPAE
jgi:hypothetical protein